MRTCCWATTQIFIELHLKHFTQYYKDFRCLHCCLLVLRPVSAILLARLGYHYDFLTQYLHEFRIEGLQIIRLSAILLLEALSGPDVTLVCM